ncbi:Probable 2-oxoglutarate-dependent dioxygenase AOP1.2 [Linum perenne]
MDSSLKIPFIDFRKAELKQGSSEWETLKQQVGKAVEEYGCFEASFDKITVDCRRAVFKSVEELFDLPLETKLLNTSKRPLHGYVGQFPSIPLYESMGIDHADILENVESLTNTLWPHGNPFFSKSIQSYAEQLSGLDQIVRQMIVERYGLEKYMDEHLNSTILLLRMMKYSPPTTLEQAQEGLNPHTDKDMITILCQNEVDGLEIQSKSGDWIHFKPSHQHQDSSFVVMVGDSLYAWLNGRVHPPVHRVLMSNSVGRYSLGLFVVPKDGYIIQSPEEMVDEEHPRLFKPYDFVDFFKFYDTKAGQKSPDALREFCGI